MSTANINVVPFTTDIKQHARNVLSLSKWFLSSSIAKNLTLSKSLELVSQAYGFNSYSALQAKLKTQPNSKFTITTAQLPKTKITVKESFWDSMFLDVVCAYLGTNKLDFDKFEINSECSPLLIYIVDRAFERGYKSNNIFLELALINYVGLRVFRDYYITTEVDRNLFEKLTSFSSFSYTASCIGLNRVYNHVGEEIGFDWLVRKGDEWVDLTLKEVNRPIHLDTDTLHNQYLLDNKTLKQILGAKHIESVTMDSTELGELWRITQGDEKIVDQMASSYYDQGYADGLFIIPSTSDGVLSAYMDNFDFKWEIAYQDMNGNPQFKSLSHDGWIDISYDNGFVVNAKFLDGKHVATTLEEKLYLAQIKQIQKVLHKNQYVLGNFFGYAFYVQDAQVDLHKRYSELLSQLEYLGCVEYAAKTLIAVNSPLHPQSEEKSKNTVKDNYVLKEHNKVLATFNTVAELMDIDAQREFSSLKLLFGLGEVAH